MSAPRLYLLTPPLAVAELALFAPRLEAALAVGDVASLLVRFAPMADAKVVLAALTPLAAARDVALLIEGDLRLAARLGVDGVHLDFAEVAEAVAAAKGQRIVGAGGLELRDDAMTAAEAGADYVMFGEPRGDGATPSLAAVVERVGWWAEIFETPCVAYASKLEDVEPLAAAGADFIALTAPVSDFETTVAAAMKLLSGAGR